MRKKGFTLIELLAVIIILAVIALIATPIVMKVIESSKKSAAERGAENYVRAVETQALALRGKGTTLDGTYGINSNGNLCPNNATACSAAEEIKIDMSGKKPSSGSIVISNGKVVSTGTSLTIEDYTATISANGSVTSTKNESGNTSSTPHYYHWTTGGIYVYMNDGLPKTNIDRNVSNITIPNNHPFYLAFDSVDGENIDAAYICFKTGNPNEEHCIAYSMDPNDLEEVFTLNQGILDELFLNSCSLDEDYIYSCSDDSLRVDVSENSATITVSNNSAYCRIDYDMSYYCGEEIIYSE